MKLNRCEIENRRATEDPRRHRESPTLRMMERARWGVGVAGAEA